VPPRNVGEDVGGQLHLYQVAALVHDALHDARLGHAACLRIGITRQNCSVVKAWRSSLVSELALHSSFNRGRPGRQWLVLASCDIQVRDCEWRRSCFVAPGN
jgi:hypothetical protein